MGILSPEQMEAWEDQQRQEHRQQANFVMVKLPCCQSAVEADPAQGDQYVECPNRLCPEAMKLGRPPRHLISWAHHTKIRSERPPLEL